MPTIMVQGRRVPLSDVSFGWVPKTRERARSEHSWSELPGNVGPSAIQNAAGLWDMVTHPQRTAQGVIDAAQGSVDRVMPETITNIMDTYVSPRSAETKERQRQVSGKLIQALKDRYEGAENLKNTLITDPVGSALDVGGLAVGGVGLLRRPVSALARSRVNGLFNPTPKPQRPFSKDYPHGVELKEDGSIAKDIEGRPLDASYIAGRTRSDAPDHSLTPLDIESVGGMGIENPIDRIPAGRFGPGIIGRTHVTQGRPTKVEVSDSLPKAEMDIATAHEVGHVIDALAGEIPTKGLQRELDFNYSALRTGEERKVFQSKPQNFGYTNPDAIDREKIAEAIRAYMVDPNYLKTVAPKTAARIREHVNTSPDLAKIIQFNGIAGGGALALGTTGESQNAHAGESPQQDPLKELRQALVRRGIPPQPPRSPERSSLIRALMARH